MAKKRGKRKGQRSNNRGGQQAKSPSKWPYIVLFLLGVGLGWLFGYDAGMKDAIDEATGEIRPQKVTDSYGRSPGHPHFGHAHP